MFENKIEFFTKFSLNFAVKKVLFVYNFQKQFWTNRR